VKFTFSWLKEYLETEASAIEIADRLSMLGLEVESIDNAAEKFAPFLICEVIKAVSHPNADRLKLCILEIGKDQVQVVCGAPNVREGMKGVFAPIGSTIPGSNIVLKSSKIRGEVSNGMICSEFEMGLSDDHDGIIELPASAPVGESWAKWASLDDVIIEIALTPNRGDCASVRGIARDLAAAGLGKLRPLEIPKVESSFDSNVKWEIDFPKDCKNACPFVVGRMFRNIKNGESPGWLKNRLKSIGLRPISALVDITNWATFALGRPLHVFDVDKISGNLTMRFARQGETLKALDEKEYKLEDGMIIIADDNGPQGIGGVMGGAASGCSAETKDVFLEVALFDPVRVAETGRKLGILSDARYRFERGIDPTSLEWGTEIASSMILKLCGGEASSLTVAGEEPKWKRQQELRTSRVQSLGGMDLSAQKQEKILSALGFEAELSGQEIKCQIPPWRPDIEGEADLVEEVMRIQGYDDIPALPLPNNAVVPAPARSFEQQRIENVRRVLAARGLVEAVTYSFLDSENASHFGQIPDELRIANPISADLDMMRPSILPNLILALSRNQARGLADVNLFEVGPKYTDDSPEGQTTVAGGLRSGNTNSSSWIAKTEPIDIFHVKADVLAALSAGKAPTDKLKVTRDLPKWYHPGRSGSICLGSHVLGQFGELHPRLSSEMGVEGPVAIFEVFIERVPFKRSKSMKDKELLTLSQFQPVNRNFAFLVDQNTDAERVLHAVRLVDKEIISNVELFDVYIEGVGKGKKSLAVKVTLQPTEATMTEKEIEIISDKILASVANQTGGILRS
jgi:phenylalanyl-tRNA synthetase beta chain